MDSINLASAREHVAQANKQVMSKFLTVEQCLRERERLLRLAIDEYECAIKDTKSNKEVDSK